MSEVSPDEILVVDKRKDKSTFASNTKSVQNIIDKLGGVHNIHLARLGSSRKTMFVEGEDIGVLGSMQNALFPSSQEPLSTIPNFSFGGWGNWKAAIWSSDLLRKEMGER